MNLPAELKLLLDTYHNGRMELADLEHRLVDWALAHPQQAELVEELIDGLRHSGAAVSVARAAVDESTRVRNLPPDRPSPPPANTATWQPSTPTTGETLTASPPPPSRDEVHEGNVLKDRFVLERLIGQGGMGAVYKARDLRKEEARDREPYVAVKVLSGDIRHHPDAFIALQREAKKAQKLAHPNTVTVYDFDRDGNVVFMTMELLEGESLAEVLRAHPQGLPLPEALPIIRGVVEGLDYAHRRGIVHADLKPGNVFVTRDGMVKVLDFGIARALRNPAAPAEDATVFDPAALGALTPAYASVEMIEGADPDPRDDVYALACLVYELLTGRHPFGRMPATQARDQALRPHPVPGLSRGQWRALQQALSHRREERTPSVRALYDALSDSRRGTATKWTAALLAVVLAAGIGLYTVLRPTPAPMPAVDPAKISELLELADLQRQSGRLLAPPGSNAYEAYHQILQLDPHNAQAQEGLDKIAGVLASEAMRLYSTDRIEDARQLLSEALRYFPDDEALLDLRARIVGPTDTR